MHHNVSFSWLKPDYIAFFNEAENEAGLLVGDSLDLVSAQDKILFVSINELLCLFCRVCPLNHQLELTVTQIALPSLAQPRI